MGNGGSGIFQGGNTGGTRIDAWVWGGGSPSYCERGFGRGLTLHRKKIEYGALKWHILNFDAFLRLIINLKDLLLHSPEHVVQVYITFQELGRPSSQFDQLLFHMVQR